jgi:hypothetical protein
MGKGECARRVNLLHSVERHQESLPYRHGGCCVALEDTAAFSPVVLWGCSYECRSDLAALGKALGFPPTRTNSNTASHLPLEAGSGGLPRSSLRVIRVIWRVPQ